MTTYKEALKLALEALKKSDGFLYNWHENASDDEADAYSTVRQLNENVITAIKEALSQQSNEQVEPFGLVSKAAHMDVIVVNLVREGINKHRARDLAEHFLKYTHPLVPTAQPKEPEQEPVAIVVANYALHWIGSGPIAPLIEKHRIKIGSVLYTTPYVATPRPQRSEASKPLTDEEIMNIAKVSYIGISPHEDALNFAKVIEAVHGIRPADLKE